MGNSGCAWCGAQTEMSLPGITFFEKDKHYLCPDCSPDRGASRIYVEDISMLVGL